MSLSEHAATLTSHEKKHPRRRLRTERREEILALRRKKKKLERRLQRVILDIEFDNPNTTSVGNFHLLETFKQSLDFNAIIRDLFTLRKSANSLYSAEETLDLLIDSNLLGYSRFEHTEALRFDPGYKNVKGIERYPSEKVFRDFLSLFNMNYIKELCEINRRLIALRSHWEGQQEIGFDIDSTVLTIFGEQEGGETRYNPRFRGRSCFELLACFISETKELLYIEICPEGKTPKTLFEEFLSKCEALLPENYILKRVRIDKGFFSETNLEYLESRHLAYAAKVPLYTNIRNYVAYVPESQWEQHHEALSYTRKKILLNTWKHDRYIDVRRVKIDKETGQMMLPEAQCYRYEAIVCSELERSPISNLNWYDGRATCENCIKEAKAGFGMDEASQHLLIKNTAYALIKAISYNIIQFFRAVALPGVTPQSWNVQTLRRKVINLPGNILGYARNRRVKLAERAYLKWLIPAIQEKLHRFLWFVANGFNHCQQSMA